MQLQSIKLFSLTEMLIVFSSCIVWSKIVFILTLNRNKSVSRLLFLSAEMFKKPMAKSVDPDQTAPLGAVCSSSTLFASILKL